MYSEEEAKVVDSIAMTEEEKRENRKARARAQQKAWASANPERVRANRAAWYRRHRAKLIAAAKKYQSTERGKASVARATERLSIKRKNNPQAYREYRRAYCARNRDRIRAFRWQREHGIASEALTALLASQGNRCALGCPGNRQHLDLDHDHSTGRVRGFLCHQANCALGFYGERVDVLLRRADALEAWATAPPRPAFLGSKVVAWKLCRAATLRAQGGRCAGCGTATPIGKRFVLDHDHACCPVQGARSCGQCVRDVLCSNCNVGQGLLGENPAIHRAAAAYLIAARQRAEQAA